MTRLFKRLRPLLAVLFLPVALAAHADDSAMPKKLTVGLLPGESAPHRDAPQRTAARASGKRPSASPSN
ncbi:hypothetical protein ACFS3C_00840 [Azotobacter vinelandii]